MHLYIPFIHKLPKKENIKQISLYIEMPNDYIKKEDKKEDKIVIIELF